MAVLEGAGTLYRRLMRQCRCLSHSRSRSGRSEVAQAMVALALQGMQGSWAASQLVVQILPKGQVDLVTTMGLVVGSLGQRK